MEEAGSERTLRPSDGGELTEVIRAALAEGRPLEPCGHGSKREFGRPVEAARLLSLERISGITLYEPGELVMRARAGTPLAEIEAVLAEQGQELAFEPSDYGVLLAGEPGRQTIGGVFACNLSGPRRIKAGAARDHLLGVTCVTGFGQEIKTGGRVMKNVTGYDLCKLLTGSHGTLAVFTELTFKVLPAAQTVATLMVGGGDEEKLLAALREAMKTPFDVSGAALLPALAAGRSEAQPVRAAGRALAVLRLEGPAPSVRYRMERLRERLADAALAFASLDEQDSRTLWREIRDVRLLSRERPLWRLSIAPTRASELSAWFRELTPEYLFDWAGGLVWLALKPEWAVEAEVLRRPLGGGHATLVRAAREVRASVPVFQPQPAPLAALTRRIKKSFDPERILNPGRMYAEL